MQVHINNAAHAGAVVRLAAEDGYNRLAKDRSLDRQKVRSLLSAGVEKGLLKPDSFLITLTEGDAVTAAAIARKSVWDTEVLERRIWNLEQVFTKGEDAGALEQLFAAVREQAGAHGAELMAYRVDTQHYAATNAALHAGFRLMETIMYMTKDLSEVSALQYSEGVTMRFAREEDIAPIIESCKGIFTASRLNKEPIIDARLVDKMYETWILNAYKDPETFFHIAEVDGKVAGFWLNRLQYNEEQLGRKLYVGRLTAVFPGFRGKGIMANLAIHSMKTLAGEGVVFDGSAVVENAPSINTLINLQFKDVYTFHTLHL